MRDKIVVTGSVAFDYLMTFPGKFIDVVVPDRMHRLSVSFLVDEMRRVRGGVAANIAYTMAGLGVRPMILAAAGEDAVDYRSWLGAQGIDVSRLEICDDVFTASFFVSTDLDQNQIATFYAGAMAKAKTLSIAEIGPATIAWAVIAPNDPTAMAQYAEECRKHDIPFVYDPSQQVARLSGDDLRAGLDGAAILIGNEYEFGVMEQKTGLSEAELAFSAPIVIKTLGDQGSKIFVRGSDEAITVPPAKLHGTAIDPTGVGDAFRGGLLAARLHGLSWEVSGRVGSVAAAYTLEALGPQPPRYPVADLIERYRESYGPDASVAKLLQTI